MGKLICDSTRSSPVITPWKDPTSSPPSIKTISAVDLSDQLITWDDVSGLEDQQKRHLQKLHTKGILWKHPGNQNPNPNNENYFPAVVFRLSHGGDVEADGNCLFTASRKAMAMKEVTASDLRRRTVRRFLEDFDSVNLGEKEAIDSEIKHMYVPDLKSGWGIHVVQEVKLLEKKSDRENLNYAIDELVDFGIQRRFVLDLNFN